MLTQTCLHVALLKTVTAMTDFSPALGLDLGPMQSNRHSRHSFLAAAP